MDHSFSFYSPKLKPSSSDYSIVFRPRLNSMSEESSFSTKEFSEKDESKKFPLPPFFIKNEMLQCTTVSNLNVAP